MSTPDFLPYGRQVIEADDIEAVTAALQSPYLTTGPLVGQFEAALGEKLQARHTVACSNGTAALHLACRAAGLRPGKLAVVPSITFVATANAARYCGADVVFADVDPDTGLMRESDFEAALERSGAANVVLPVHLNGQTEDLPAIHRIARDRDITVIEDACHAAGTTYRDGAGAVHSVGTTMHSDMACFSFHPVKAIAMGEGGAVTTRIGRVAQFLARDRSHGLIREADEFTQADGYADLGRANPWYYELHEPGFNYRVPDILCALGISQLAKFDRFVAARRKLVALYDERLRDLHECVRPLGRVASSDPAWHLNVALIDFDALGIDRATFMQRLTDKNVGSQVHYYPVHRQPYYVRRYGKTHLPGADEYYRRALSLPLYPAMTEADVDRVVDALRSAIKLGAAQRFLRKAG